MAATQYAADTPLLATGLVATGGVFCYGVSGFTVSDIYSLPLFLVSAGGMQRF